MISKMSKVAERLAATVSRRGFLGWMGRAGAAMATVLGLPSYAHAQGQWWCCRCTHNKPGPRKRTLCSCGFFDTEPNCAKAGYTCKSTIDFNCALCCDAF